MTTGTGTAQLLFGAAHQKRGGVMPLLSMWLMEDTHLRWQVRDAEFGHLDWVPRTTERVVADALVLLVALTSTPRDPVPVALTEMAPDVRWREGLVDLTTWRRYDGERLDALVAAAEPAGKVVLSVLPEASVPGPSLDPLARLDWDLDVLLPHLSRRRTDRDLHQSPPPGLPGPAIARHERGAPHLGSRPHPPRPADPAPEASQASETSRADDAHDPGPDHPRNPLANRPRWWT